MRSIIPVKDSRKTIRKYQCFSLIFFLNQFSFLQNFWGREILNNTCSPLQIFNSNLGINKVCLN